MRCLAGLLVCIGALLGWNDDVEARAHLLLEEMAIAAPRFAEGDLDGDGRDELVIGGRVGPFRPVTDPLGARSARVEVYAPNAGGLANPGWFDLQAVSEELRVVEDVAVGDLDGDGRAEVVAVGAHRLVILRYAGGQLSVEDASLLADGRFRRVECADVDGDGNAEVVVVEMLPGNGGEVPNAEIRLCRFAGDWRDENLLSVAGHVGDICLADFDGDGSVELALEQGGEETGGWVRVFDFAGGGMRERFGQQLTGERDRVLSMAVWQGDGTALLGAGTLDGRIGLWRLRGAGFAQVEEVVVSGGMLRGLHLATPSGANGVRVISGIAPPGEPRGQVWILEGAILR